MGSLRLALVEFFDLASEGGRRVLAHKLRSLLTLSGLILGVAALVAMLSFVDAIKEMVDRDLRTFASRNTVEFVNEPLDRSTALNRASRGLHMDDLGTLDGVAGVVRVHALRYDSPWITGPRGSFRISVQGSTPGQLWDYRMVPVRGREITHLDVARSQRVAVLGTAAAERLFGEQDPVGREIRIATSRYTVVGVVTPPIMRLIPVGDQGWRDHRIYVPVTTLSNYHAGTKALSAVWVTAFEYEGVGAVIGEAERRLERAHRGIRDFRLSDAGAVSYAELSELVARITSGWNIAMGGIALLSLLVGGIGLFSVLLISVRERVREIGVRKAVGATEGDIRREFLAESMTLAAAGGVLGVVAGAGICLAAEWIAGSVDFLWTVPVSPLGVTIGVVFALGTGFLFGLYPARRAAALDPIQAIRG